MDVTVTTYGPMQTTLQIKYVLIDRAFAYKFANDNQAMLQTFIGQGFKKVVLTDGYDTTYMFDLIKQQGKRMLNQDLLPIVNLRCLARLCEVLQIVPAPEPVPSDT